MHPQSHSGHNGGQVHGTVSPGPGSFLTSFIGNLGAPLDVDDEGDEDRDRGDDDSEEMEQISDRLGPHKVTHYDPEI